MTLVIARDSLCRVVFGDGIGNWVRVMFVVEITSVRVSSLVDLVVT